MTALKCRMCGGDVLLIKGTSFGRCQFCGTKQTITTTSEEKYRRSFNRANVQRKNLDFEGAASTYNQLLADCPKEAEVYWGLCLCKYGIEYVQDPNSGDSLPTCYRFKTASILDDQDYLQARENADSVAREYYLHEATLIDRIQKQILEIVSRDKPYDVFISFCQHDDHNHRTEDDVIAQKLYHRLTMEGIRSFYSPVSLKGLEGEKFEPSIFAALFSSKILLLIGTQNKYLQSTWVKNEWTRFFSMMQTDHAKTALICFKKSPDGNVVLPKVFEGIQGFDIEEDNRFFDDVVNRIKNLCAPHVSENLSLNTSTNPESHIQKGNLALGNLEWSVALKCFEKAVDIDPHCARGYLGMFLVNNHAPSLLDVDGGLADFNDSKWNNALKFADDKLKEEIDQAKEKWAKDWDALPEKIKIRKEVIDPADKLLAANEEGYIAAKTDGTVICVVKGCDEGEGKQIHLNWSHISAVYAGENDSLGSVFCGVKKDGTLLMVSVDGYSVLDVCDESIANLYNVSSVSIGKGAVVIIYNDKRSEVLEDYSNEAKSYANAHENISKAVVGDNYIAYLTTDQQLIVDGEVNDLTKIMDTEDIINISAIDDTLVVLNKHGQIVSSDPGFNHFASGLKGVIDVKKAFPYATFGYMFMLLDGSLLSYEYDRSWQREFGSGTVASFGCGRQFCITLSDYGYLIATKKSDDNQEHQGEQKTIKDSNPVIKLFSDLKLIEEEQKEAIEPKVSSSWAAQYKLNLQYRNLIAVNDHAVAFVRSNGTVEYISKSDAYHADSATQKWNRIIAVAMNDDIVVGLNDEGKVFIANDLGDELNNDVNRWPAIKQIAVTEKGLLGLDLNGRVHTTDNRITFKKLTEWEKIDRIISDHGNIYGITLDSRLLVLCSEKVPEKLQTVTNVLDIYPSSFVRSAAVLCKDHSIVNFQKYNLDMSSVIQCCIEKGDVYYLLSDGQLFKNTERMIYSFHDDILDRDSKYDEFIAFTCNIWGRCAAITKYGYIAIWNYDESMAKRVQLSRIIKDYDLENLESERRELFELRKKALTIEEEINASYDSKAKELDKAILEKTKMLEHEREQISFWDNQRKKFSSSMRFFLQQAKYREAGEQQEKHNKQYHNLQVEIDQLKSSWIGPYIVSKNSLVLDPYCNKCHESKDRYICYLDESQQKAYVCLECAAQYYSIKNGRFVQAP